MLAGGLISLVSSGCGYSEKEYMAKVNRANEYQRLVQQRQAALVTNEKKVKFLENALQTFQKNLAIAQTEKKRETEQNKINKLHLDPSREALKKISAQLENTEGRLASMEKNLEEAYQELAKTNNQLKRRDIHLQQTNIQLREKDAQLQTKERQLSENASQLQSIRLQFQEVEERLTIAGKQLEKSMSLNKNLEKNAQENLLQITSMEQKEKNCKGRSINSKKMSSI